MDKLYIVIPAYNEEENILTVVQKWYSVLDYGSQDSKIVVADSGSTDKTHEILVELQKSYSKLEILQNTEKGHGPKVMALYEYALKNEADYIFQTDGDNQTKPEEFEDFWKERKKYDAIVGKRIAREDGKIRAFVEGVVCFLLRLIFNIKIPDANAPFRLMKAYMLKKYIKRLPANYNLPNIMFTTFWVYYGEAVLFKEISFLQREKGKNSINLFKIFKIGMAAVGDWIQIKKRMKLIVRNEEMSSKR